MEAIRFVFGLIKRWVRGFLRAPEGERFLYLRRGLKGLYRKAVDRAPFSVEKRLQGVLSQIHPDTLSRHADVALWAERRAQGLEAGEGVSTGNGELQEQHRSLMTDLDHAFQSRWRDSWARVLIHLPPPERALAWASNVRNMLDCFRYMGIEAQPLPWGQGIESALMRSKPNVLLTLWHEDYLARIDWNAVRKYRAHSPLLIGINAPEEELYGPAVVRDILSWARESRVSFFFKERPKAYLAQAYEPYWAAGHEVLALEYGANPLVYHPVAGAHVDLNYSFLGSLHRDKWSRYLSHFGPILRRHPGFLMGPGWPTEPQKTLPPEAHRFVYARAALGLNLHHAKQLTEPVEMNERTYNLASTGIPQIVDSPMLLTERFSEEAFFCARSADEFHSNFEEALHDPMEARKRALLAHRQVLTHHTMFHRLGEFVADIERLWHAE